MSFKLPIETLPPGPGPCPFGQEPLTCDKVKEVRPNCDGGTPAIGFPTRNFGSLTQKGFYLGGESGLKWAIVRDDQGCQVLVAVWKKEGY